jgi:cell fate (sporulation/competence/biofilm development) regulator YlbF (YheA/YmcA/DUF963 family)
MKELQPNLKHATQDLGNALKNTPSLRAYLGAKERMATDAQAIALLDEFQRVQSDIRVRQSDSSLTQADLTRLRQLQSDVQTNPTIAAFGAAEQEAKSYVRQVNLVISDLLGIDFASLGRVSGCC